MGAVGTVGVEVGDSVGCGSAGKKGVREREKKRERAGEIERKKERKINISEAYMASASDS
jgi:hypothetical protein